MQLSSVTIALSIFASFPSNASAASAFTGVSSLSVKVVGLRTLTVGTFAPWLRNPDAGTEPTSKQLQTEALARSYKARIAGRLRQGGVPIEETGGAALLVFNFTNECRPQGEQHDECFLLFELNVSGPAQRNGESVPAVLFQSGPELFRSNGRFFFDMKLDRTVDEVAARWRDANPKPWHGAGLAKTKAPRVDASHDPNLAAQFSRPVVILQHSDLHYRAECEGLIVKGLKAKHVEAVEGMSLSLPMRDGTWEKLAATLKAAGVDAIVYLTTAENVTDPQAAEDSNSDVYADSQPRARFAVQVDDAVTSRTAWRMDGHAGGNVYPSFAEALESYCQAVTDSLLKEGIVRARN